jgi:formylglycine-generating enzyme required for sulfatase activity
MVAAVLLVLASMPATLQAGVPQVDASRRDGARESGASCPPEMVFIPAASVPLGAAVSALSLPPNPPHVATLRAFCIDRLEVSVATYKSCPWCARSGNVDAGVCRDGSDLLPIRCITQQEAEQYCSSHGRRLPSSDEWEYAARGTDQRMYPWGNTVPSPTFSLPREVGTDPRDVSPFGVTDMGGNIGEWVADRAPRPLAGQCGVVRGATFLTRQHPQWPSSVVFTGCDVPTPIVGVRCAMDVP